jgi:hypothetical protein
MTTFYLKSWAAGKRRWDGSLPWKRGEEIPPMKTDNEFRMQAAALALAIFSGTVVLLLLTCSACIHKKGGNVSPYEQAVTYNTMLAEINNSIAQGVITVEQSALMPTETANNILTFQKLVADDHEKLTKILGAGKSGATDQASTIQSVLAEMRIQAGALINSGGLAIKNPKSQRLFTEDLNSLLSLVNQIASSLHSAGVLKQ